MAEGESIYNAAEIVNVGQPGGGARLEVAVRENRPEGVREKSTSVEVSVSQGVAGWFMFAREAYKSRGQGNMDKWFMFSSETLARQAMVEGMIDSYGEGMIGTQEAWSEGYMAVRRQLGGITFLREDLGGLATKAGLLEVRRAVQRYVSAGELPEEGSVARRYADRIASCRGQRLSAYGRSQDLGEAAYALVDCGFQTLIERVDGGDMNKPLEYEAVGPLRFLGIDIMPDRPVQLGEVFARASEMRVSAVSSSSETVEERRRRLGRAVERARRRSSVVAAAEPVRMQPRQGGEAVPPWPGREVGQVVERGGEEVLVARIQAAPIIEEVQATGATRREQEGRRGSVEEMIRGAEDVEEGQPTGQSEEEQLERGGRLRAQAEEELSRARRRGERARKSRGRQVRETREETERDQLLAQLTLVIGLMEKQVKMWQSQNKEMGKQMETIREIVASLSATRV